MSSTPPLPPARLRTLVLHNISTSISSSTLRAAFDNLHFNVKSCRIVPRQTDSETTTAIVFLADAEGVQRALDLHARSLLFFGALGQIRVSSDLGERMTSTTQHSRTDTRVETPGETAAGSSTSNAQKTSLSDAQKILAKGSNNQPSAQPSTRVMRFGPQRQSGESSTSLSEEERMAVLEEFRQKYRADIAAGIFRDSSATRDSDGGGSSSETAQVGGAAGDTNHFGFELDPEYDPELALALQVTFEEEKARQEKKKEAQEGAQGKGKERAEGKGKERVEEKDEEGVEKKDNESIEKDEEGTQEKDKERAEEKDKPESTSKVNHFITLGDDISVLVRRDDGMSPARESAPNAEAAEARLRTVSELEEEVRRLLASTNLSNDGSKK